MDPDTTDKRLAELEADVRRRLAQICRHMPEEEFTELVRSIAQNARRAERFSNWPVRRNPSDEPERT